MIYYWLWLIIGVSLYAPLSFANGMENVGGSSYSQARAQIGWGHFDASVHNPAWLMSQNSVGLSFQGLFSQLTLENMGNTTANNRAQTPPSWLAFTAGGQSKLSGIFNEKAAIGFVLHAPISQSTTASLVDVDTPFFVSHHDGDSRLDLRISLAASPLSWLDIGIGIQFLASLTGPAVVDVSLVEGRVTKETIDLSLKPTIAPTVGVTCKPLDNFMLSLSYLSEISLYYNAPITANIEEVGPLTVNLFGEAFYTPHRVNLDAQYTLDLSKKQRLLFSTGLEYRLWSLAPSPYPQVGFSLDGEHIGISEQIKLQRSGEHIGFIDQISPYLVADYRDERLKMALSYRFRSRFVTNGSAYPAFGNASHLIAVGMGYDISQSENDALFIEASALARLIETNENQNQHASGFQLGFAVDFGYRF